MTKKDDLPQEIEATQDFPIKNQNESAVFKIPAKIEKECPFCSELIKETAKKCKHCGEILDVVLRAADDSKKTQNVFMNSSSASAAVAVTESKSFPHILHLIMTVLTGGLWLIIWLIHYLLKGR